MHFTKMHGLGNDYLYIYGEPVRPEQLAIRLSDRHFGVGSDGMIYICPSEIADFGMRIFNADGSEAMMCGNGIRCVGKYVFEKGYTDQTELDIETKAGIRHLSLHLANDKVESVTVRMGKAVVSEPDTLQLPGMTEAITYTAVNVGNPHAVIFVPDLHAIELARLGSAIETHERFPGGVNVEFIQVLQPDKLRMRVWERGSGITMACGTGACASAAAAVARGYCPPDTQIAMLLDGGILRVWVPGADEPDEQLRMTGPAEFVFEGDVIV